VGRLGAFGLRATKPGGPPIGSGPGCIWVGGATAAATVTVFSKFGPVGRVLGLSFLMRQTGHSPLKLPYGVGRSSA
jgi:hypothetical protein